MTRKTFILFFLLLVVIVKNDFSGDRGYKEWQIGGYAVYTDTIADSVHEQLIDSNINKLVLIHETFEPAEMAKLSAPANKVIIKTDTKKTKTAYELKNDKNSLLSAYFDKNNCIRQIYFDLSGLVKRSYTLEEKKYHDQTGEIPQTYCTISKNDAIELAKKLHLMVYGKNEHEKFDSISVRVYDMAYGVIFNVKQKNDIADTRTSTIIINPNTGLIERFSGEGLGDVEFDYIPTITKATAIQMYLNEISQLGATITVDSMDIHLKKFSKSNENGRWTWHIYGVRHDKDIGHAAFMAIDSETGEVLFKSMDY